MGQFYVYVLECDDKSYYVGITNNLMRRLDEHSSGYNPDSYTSRRLPVKLIYHRVFKDPVEAIAFEKKLKGWSRKKKEAYMAGEWNELKRLSRCLNPTRSDRPK